MADNVIHTKTVIVGAGVSGISTAISLLKKEYTDFLVFEALDRTGGRVNTIDYADGFLEIGAQFIHGQSNNPIYHIARNNKLIDKKYDKLVDDDDDEEEEEDEDKKFLYVTQHGKKVDLKIVYKLEDILERVYDNVWKIKQDGDAPVAEVFYKNYIKRVEKVYSKDLNMESERDFKKLVDGMFVWRCRSENIELACFSLYQISLNNFDAFEEHEGADIELLYGYRSVIDAIIEPYKEDFEARLNLDSPLKKILLCKSQLHSRPKSGAAVFDCEHCLYTKDKDRVVCLFEDHVSNESCYKAVVCENVVCTMSLGYMKEHLEGLIEPASLMPREKLQAVKRIGFGTVNKIFMAYEEPFWEKELSEIYPICVPDDEETVKSVLNGTGESNWVEHVAYFQRAEKHDKLLVAWIGGDVFSEQLSDEEVSRDLTEYLRKILNRQDIPEPVKIERSGWGSDPYFKGSYSHMPLGCEEDDFSTIAEPIWFNDVPYIMFAGEGTIRKYHSTVHGAFVTGQREAKRILDNWADYL